MCLGFLLLLVAQSIIKFGGICRGFSWRTFLGTSSHKNEGNNSSDKIREKISAAQKNQSKFRSSEDQPWTLRTVRYNVLILEQLVGET